MTIDEKKAKVQAEANAAIDANDGFGLIAMATGTGKSKIGVDRASDYNTIYDRTKVLLVVPTEKLRDEGWKLEFEKWDKGWAWPQIERTCYASLDNYESEDFDIVILDECHHITPNNAIFFNNNTVKSCIGLTATPPKDPIKVRLLADILHVPIIHHSSYKLELVPSYQITLDQAVKMSLVAPYEVTIITMPLDDKDKYIKAGKKDSPFYQTEQQRYNYLTQSVTYGVNPMARINRMRFLYNLRYKTLQAINILKHVIPQDTKTLIFCGTKEQANQICEYRYYSKPSKPKSINIINVSKPYLSAVKIEKYTSDLAKYKEQIKNYQGNDSYNLFFEEKINRLACVDALNEGVNLPMIDCAFMIKLDSQELNFIQRLGRIIRLREGHIGKIIILATENTVEIEWIQKAMFKLDNTKIRWITLDDLRNARETITF